MSAQVACIDPTWAGFRSAARALLRERAAPDRVTWCEREEADPQLALLETAPLRAPRSEEQAGTVPRRFVELGETVSCHRDPAPWSLLYRILWRIRAGERALLGDAADVDVVAAGAMERAVRRDAHKMTAFVRFRAVRDAGGERFVAWFEPRHRIVRRTAPFFERRFPSMRWSILTPDECVHWDGAELHFTPGATRDAAPDGDALEDAWLTYYAHTFNPARVRVQAMRAEMPLHYWRNLPETVAIPGLLREAPARVRAMIERAGGPSRGSAGGAARPARAVRAATPRLEPPPESAPVRTDGVRVGVAGWDYPDWAGRVYPEARQGVDRLRWVAARFDLLEVNSTFYRPASPRAARSWLERTADFPGLRFTAKLLRAFTHGEGWREADVAAVKAGMAPLLEAGKLTSLLVQFPWSFRHRDAETRRLARVLDAFSDYPLHVEVRHASWDEPAFRDMLAARRVGIVNVDQPLFHGSLGPAAEATSRVAYIRLHGRNAEAWFREGATRDERYDYSYSAEELAPWVARARDLAARPEIDEVEVVFNNHYRGQAVHDAETFALALRAAQGPPSA